MSKTKIYKVWSGMRDRCSNPNNKHYANYGGRGISVDSEWELFSNFYRDMGGAYKEGLTLERVDNSLGYSKFNCKWIPRRKQLLNTRRNIYLTLGNKTQTITAWSKEIGISYQSLKKRLRNGWPLYVALTRDKSTKRFKTNNYGK